jgi:hypothetical protein
MPLLSTDQFWLAYSDGVAQRTCLFAVKNVDAADTIDLSGYFKVVKRAGVVSATGTQIAACAVSGTPPVTLTIPAGPVDDALWLLVVGVST